MDIENSNESAAVENIPQKTVEQLTDESYLDDLAEVEEGAEGEQGEAEPMHNMRTDIEALTALLQAFPLVMHIANYKNMAEVFSVDNCQNLSAALVPVLHKHGWGQRVIEFLRSGAGIEEAALLFVVVPMGMALMRAYELDVKANQKEKEVKASDSDDEVMQDGKTYETENGSTFKMAGNVDDVKNG